MRVKKFVLIPIFAYILLGIFLVKDYNISTDEPTERQTMYVNLNYVLTRLGKDSMDVPQLEEYQDKYYGIFMQMPTAVFEFGHKELRYIFYWRHLYTFSLCLFGYIAFFFLCKRLFDSNLLGMLGTVMVAFYPRFFAEQFYNIKDMVFVSVFMISMWATVQLIEQQFSWRWLILFSFISAVATNVRIVGIIFIILVIAYIWMMYILDKIYKSTLHSHTLKKNILITGICLGLYLIFLFILMPVAWENPIKNITEMFKLFSDYNSWHGSIIFMGQELGAEESLPWYYIPVWMLISVPIWYILFAVLTGGICIKRGISLIKEKNTLLNEFIYRNKYLIWCCLLAGIPWLGIVINHATLYNGWRHCYFILPPLVLFILYGVDYLKKKGSKNVLIIVGLVITIGIVDQLGWIIINHPYEMVYFNNIGRRWAADFDRDYWGMAELQAYKYIAKQDKSDKITINTSGAKHFLYLLDKEERNKIEIVDDPMYYIETYRGRIGNDFQMEGYEEIYSIIVDDFKVASVMRKNN